MFLKNNLKHLIAIILIFLIALGTSFLIKPENFTKRNLIVDYKFTNYYLTTPGYIHGYLNIIMPILQSDQYFVIDEVLISDDCKMLKTDVNAFTIINRPHNTYRAELFTNKIVSNKDLDICFKSFMKEMNMYTKKLFTEMLTADIELLEGSIKTYEQLLSDDKLFQKKYETLPIILKSKQDKEKIFSITKFLNEVNNSPTLFVISKKHSSFIVTQRVIFGILFFFTYCYIFHISKFL